MPPNNPISKQGHQRPLSSKDARHYLLASLRYGDFWSYVWGQLLISRRGRFWPVALAVLPASLGIPGWLETPWWIRPIVLASIAGVALYGQARSEYEQEHRSRRERLAFADAAANLFRAEGDRIIESVLGEQNFQRERRQTDIERSEVEALKREIQDLNDETKGTGGVSHSVGELYARNRLKADSALLIKKHSSNIAKNAHEEMIYLGQVYDGSLLTSERQNDCCIRDLNIILQYISYGLFTDQGSSMLDDLLLNGLKETYRALDVPIIPIIRAIELMKKSTVALVDQDIRQETEMYFDYIINSLT
jgi:allophycocyanin beta subunit